RLEKQRIRRKGQMRCCRHLSNRSFRPTPISPEPVQEAPGAPEELVQATGPLSEPESGLPEQEPLADEELERLLLLRSFVPSSAVLQRQLPRAWPGCLADPSWHQQRLAVQSGTDRWSICQSSPDT